MMTKHFLLLCSFCDEQAARHRRGLQREREGGREKERKEKKNGILNA